jgi:hypothetical protein
MELAMKSNNKTHPGSKREQPSLREEPSLDHRYGKIGISAVAAALRYQSEAKKPDAPVAPRDEKWRAEVAA